MLNNLSSYSPKHFSALFKVAVAVVIAHLSLLGLAKFWTFSPSIAPSRSKVIVQTIELHSSSTSKPLSSSFYKNDIIDLTPIEPVHLLSTKPIELNKNEIKPMLKKEEFAVLEEAIAPTKEESLSSKPVSSSTSTLLDSSKAKNLPKLETSPKTIETKTSVQAKPFLNKKSPVIKKESEVTKKSIKNEEIKPKTQPELEKIKQQQITKEKKQLQDHIEAEKKRQKEQEAEKKRQQEIAATQEALAKSQKALSEKLNKAKENLSKANETNRQKNQTSSIKLETRSLPKELGQLHIESLSFTDNKQTEEATLKAKSYSQDVATFLKKNLQLPDYGTVKIKLILNREGKVIKIETLESESSKNKHYLESKIVSFSFPAFGQRLPDLSQNTFIITLQNDS